MRITWRTLPAAATGKHLIQKVRVKGHWHTADLVAASDAFLVFDFVFLY